MLYTYLYHIMLLTHSMSVMVLTVVNLSISDIKNGPNVELSLLEGK